MPCELQFLTGARAGSSVRLEQTSFWIGRDPRCELALDPEVDLQASAHHAQVTRDGGTYQLRDQSTNGTFVNGHAVKQATLVDGDVIELGRGGPRLLFRGQPAAAVSPAAPHAAGAPAAARVRAAAPAPTGRGPATPATVAAPAPAGLAPATVAAVAAVAPPTIAAPAARADGPAAPAESKLRIELERTATGQRQVFTQPVIRIGRDPGAEVAFDLQADLLVSYSHAKIMVLEGRAVLFDTDSKNGTFVGAQRVTRLDLQGGEVIELGRGGPRLRVNLTSERPAGPAARNRISVSSATVFGSADAFRNLSLGDAAPLGEHTLDGGVLTIGRDPENRIVLDSMYVSARHALVERQGNALHLRDAGSINGLYLGGERITDAVLTPGAEFAVGPYVCKYTGNSVVVFDTRTKTWVDAYDLCRTDRRTGRNFLDHVSLKIRPGEFVTILGPSGCGKSTLLKSLNGYTRADSGRVLMNNVDFYANYEAVKHQVGYVPQDDIIHPQLSVWRTLEYAARLRLPPGTPAGKREERIRDVLSVLELYDHRNKPIHRLSGGQRKRVSIAVELLTDPAIIYLDEPTSGLDPNLEEKMMLLLREMTLRGKTVATVTHTLDNIHLADKVTFLVDGKLAFFGSEEEARSFFQVQRLPDVYKRFDEHRENTEALRRAFESSPIFEKNVRSQLQPPAAAERRAPRKERRVGPGALRQFWVLTSRYLEILTRDLRNTLILLLQAPLVALFIALAVKTDQPDRGPTSTMFLIMSLSALWFGCSNAARELTKESSIYARERMLNLRVIPYVASKFFVLQFLALVQVATMLILVQLLRSGFTLAEAPPGCERWGIAACSQLILGGVPGSFWLHLLNLYLTALNGIGLGLLVSALAGNSDKAMSLVPLVLIPQVLFSGSFGIPQADEVVKRGAGYVMSLNWSLDQAKRIAMCSPAEERLDGRGGGGCRSCLHGHDPFKHQLLRTESQSDDSRCRAVLPLTSQMTDFPESLQVVEDGLYTPRAAHGQGEARDATRAQRGLLVLGGYTLTLFILICIFVRLKDRQHL